jgi:hypothetical protein
VIWVGVLLKTADCGQAHFAPSFGQLGSGASSTVSFPLTVYSLDEKLPFAGN